MNDLRVSHTGGPGSWRGLIKRGKETVWRCDHAHPNRDDDAGHTAALPCASLVLSALLDPDKFKRDTETMLSAGCSVGGPQAAYAMRRFVVYVERRRWAIQQAEALQASMGRPVEVSP